MPTLLGDYIQFIPKYDQFNEVIQKYSPFVPLNTKRKNGLFQEITQEIENISTPCFLLPSLLNALNQTKIPFSDYEFWLLYDSEKSELEQHQIRGKISGKLITREAYQTLFPIGMETYFNGSHSVIGHLSPDLDTTVASFLGWLDAFSARVGKALHYWCLPGGFSDPSMEALFERFFGPQVDKWIAKKALKISSTAIDLIDHDHVFYLEKSTSLKKMDVNLHENAIILVDANGYFIGDWHSIDEERVRPYFLLFNSFMREIQTHFSLNLTRFFAETNPSLERLKHLQEQSFKTPLNGLSFIQDLDEEERRKLEVFLKKGLNFTSGLEGNLVELANTLATNFHQTLSGLSLFIQTTDELSNALKFDLQGLLIENRTELFQYLEKVMTLLDETIQQVKMWMERLGTGFLVKQQILEDSVVALHLLTEVEEIRIKMGTKDYLPIVIQDQNGLLPLGVVRAESLSNLPLGTVSFRDFSNFEEVHLAPYLNVISVIDHHRSNLKTVIPSLILIGDAQSCNTLIAEQLFLINDSERNSLDSFIHPDREIAEYFVCLYAILDDTDLLNKASIRDTESISRLINRLNDLINKDEAKEIIQFNDLIKDEHFFKKAIQRILQNPEMHSIYSKIMQTKEKELEFSLSHSSEEFLFSDTKEQNGCCRIGQIKLYSSLHLQFFKKIAFVLSAWLKKSKEVYNMNPFLDLHLMMISTIPSADDLYRQINTFDHDDQLWIWAAPTREGYSHLALFLNNFQNSAGLKEKVKSAVVYGDFKKELNTILVQNFFPLIVTEGKNSDSFIVFQIKAGSLNSRKAMLSPFLPTR